MNGIRSRIKLIGGLLTAGISVLGTIRTLVEIGAGQQFSLQQLAFYIGASACAVYLAGIAGLIVGGLISSVTGDHDNVMLVIAGGVSVLMLIILIDAGVLWDYEGTDAIGRGFMALLGVAGLAVGAWLYRQGDKRETVADPSG